MKKKENVSTVFLLPGIEIKDELKDLFYTFGFENTFLTCPPLSYPYEVIYLLFKPVSINMDFMRSAERLQINENFIETLDGGNNKVVLVYRIPKRFKRDYEMFLEGKYSKLGEDFKKCFVLEEFVKDINGKPVKENGRYLKEPSDFFHIFNQTDKIKDKWKERLGYSEDEHILDGCELYSKQDPIEETLEEELWLG